MIVTKNGDLKVAFVEAYDHFWAPKASDVRNPSLIVLMKAWIVLVLAHYMGHCDIVTPMYVFKE